MPPSPSRRQHPTPTAMPPAGTPHLAAPDALPPGTTMDPNAVPAESPNVSYLKDLWQAVQTHEISGKEALIMGLAQRGMNTPIPAQAPGPNVPITPGRPGGRTPCAARARRRPPRRSVRFRRPPEPAAAHQTRT